MTKFIPLLVPLLLLFGCQQSPDPQIKLPSLVSIDKDGDYVFAHPDLGFKFEIEPSWTILPQELLDKQLHARGVDADGAQRLVLSLLKTRENGIASSLNVIDGPEYGQGAAEFLEGRIRKVQKQGNQIQEIQFASEIPIGDCQFETLSFIQEKENKRYCHHYWVTERDGNILVLFARYGSPEQLAEIKRLINNGG